MIETHLNIFDAVVLGIMALSCLFAFFRGLVREILSLAAWIGAAIVTLHYFSPAAEKLQVHFKSPMVAIGVASIGLYLGSLIVFAIINTIIIKTFKAGQAGTLDNLLGLVFGFCRGVLIISLGFFMLSMAIPEKEEPDWLKESVTRPYVAKGAVALAKIAPEYLQEIANLQKKATDELNSKKPSDSPADSLKDEPVIKEESKENIGYTPSATSQMNRLIQSTGKDQ